MGIWGCGIKGMCFSAGTREVWVSMAPFFRGLELEEENGGREKIEREGGILVVEVEGKEMSLEDERNSND